MMNHTIREWLDWAICVEADDAKWIAISTLG